VNLALDLGNTTSRLFIYDGARRIGKRVISNLSTEMLEEFVEENSVRSSILSSVIDYDPLIAHLLHSRTDFIKLNSDTPLPIDNFYKTKETLGTDRIANAVAGAVLYPEKNVLIVDVGTCIKYDFVNYKGQYLGGSISPGFRMRLDAMHHYTDKLPQLEPTYASGIGTSTKDAMMTGAFRGIIHEINGFINEYSARFEPIVIILTGGDTRHFEEELNFPIFAEPDLTGIGLNEILLFNKTRH
jgi:type III pantothenate kinase